MIKNSTVYAALKNGQFRILFDELRLRLWSTVRWYGFERDLSIPMVCRESQIPVHIRELRKDDIPVLLNLADAKDGKAFKDRLIRLLMVRADIPTCYVAVTSEGVPCTMQWMISSDANDRVKRFSRGGLPILKENEVLLENAFTLERYRRQGIENETHRYLFQLALEKGVKRAVTFVRDQSSIPLKMASKLGFTQFCLKTCRWRLFLRHYTFKQIPKKTAEKQIRE
jgi:hypothetical protein